MYCDSRGINKGGGDKRNEIRMNVWLKCDESETGIEQKESGS